MASFDLISAGKRYFWPKEMILVLKMLYSVKYCYII